MNPSSRFASGGGDGDESGASPGAGGEDNMKISSSSSPPSFAAYEQQGPSSSVAGISLLRTSPSHRVVRLEQEVAWNPVQVYVDLQAACQILSDRGWKLAAKWAAEQWMGLPAVDVETATTTNVRCSIPDDLHSSSSLSSPMYTYAKTLLDLGEFAHAAAVLSQPHATVERMPAPLTDLPAAAIGLRAYALYMAGERRKEETLQEVTSSKTTKHVPNPYLKQLCNEMLVFYERELLDAFGLHVYGMVLSASHKAPLPPQTPAPQTVLIQSLLAFPYNWSAWLDLAECAMRDRSAERDIEMRLQPVLGGHFMYHFFCAHLQSAHQDHAAALQIYEKWTETALLGGSPYLLTECAVSHYHLRQFGAAQRLLEDLHNDMPYRLDSMDIYSNILYVQEDAVTLAQLAHTAVQVDKYRPETSCIVGNYYSLKQQRSKAIQAFQRALALDRTYVSAWTLMGHEYVEWKQTAHAMEAYRQAVHVAPNDYRAWYGLGQTYEFLSMYLYALYYYKQATHLRPNDARMWCAIGQVLVHLQRPKEAIRAYERALQLDDSEGVATLKLATLYQEQSLTEKAAQCYSRHLQLRYVASQPPGKASLNSIPPLDLMLPQLVVQEPEAEALLFLAQYHRDHGEYETASLFAARLLEYPGPEKESAKALLRDIRSRKSQPRRVYQTRSRGPPSEFNFSP